MGVINQYSRFNGIMRTGDVILSVNGKDIDGVTDLPAEIDVVSDNICLPYVQQTLPLALSGCMYLCFDVNNTTTNIIY